MNERKKKSVRERENRFKVRIMTKNHVMLYITQCHIGIETLSYSVYEKSRFNFFQKLKKFITDKGLKERERKRGRKREKETNEQKEVKTKKP